MSTYWYLVCDVHRVCSKEIAINPLSGDWRQVDPANLTQFIEKHGSCLNPRPQLVNEHDERTDNYQKLEVG